MRADFRLNLPPIGSHPLRSYALSKPHYLTVPAGDGGNSSKALPVLVFAVFFSDDRKDILPAAMSVGIGFSILENTAILVQNLTVVTLGWAALRGLSASLMHGLCTMIIGAGLPYVKKQKEAVLHRYLRILYRFRNDARPVQPADPIRLQLAGRLFSHGIVCAVLRRSGVPAG